MQEGGKSSTAKRINRSEFSHMAEQSFTCQIEYNVSVGNVRHKGSAVVEVTVSKFDYAEFEDATVLKATPEAQVAFEAWRNSGSKEALRSGNFEYVRQALLDGLPNVLPEAEVKNALEKLSCEGSDVYTLSGAKDDNIVLFIHGGAWVMPMIDEQLTFSDHLVDTMDAKVYMPLYPLGPQHTYPETYAMLIALYKELLKLDKPIYIVGDSAGGHLSIMLSIMIRDAGLRAAEKLVLLAPAADLSFSNPDIAKVEGIDPRLALFGTVECTKMWVGNADPKDPIISPNYADLGNLPDTILFVGDHDILCPDDLIFAKRMKAAGNKLQLVVGEGLWHVFSTASIPERDDSLKIIRDFCF